MEVKKLFSTDLFKRKNGENSQQGFGTFYGVYLPGVLTMFGVIIYLRLAWIVGSLGLLQTVAVVALSCLIVFITALSISSAATNMHVGGGGTYYMVSRSLGIEIGSAIGVPLFIAQALVVSFCTIGFAESIHPFLPNIPLNYIAVGTLVLLMGFVYFSVDVALKAQLFIFLIILASMASLFSGEPLPTESVEAFDKSMTIPFWVGFALFFPATTGIESGVSMSGNLHSPKKSLPLGTITIILTGFLVYLIVPFFLWSHVPRSLLVTDPLIVQHAAKIQSLIMIGIWATTLSSVLSGLLAAPRTLQALASDGVFPEFLAKEWGKNKEPRAATLFCFVVAIIGICYGSINQIAPILTMFYLIAYATLNLATGLEELLGNPSWRPTFHVHWSISMAGVFLCLLAMFMIDSGATFIALFFVIALYLYMRKRNFAKKWEDIQHGLLVFLSRFAIYRLAEKQFSARAWRPNFLVLSESPMQVNHLVNVTSAISEGKGFLTLASVFSPQIVDYERAERWKKLVSSHLKENKIEALVEFCMDENLLSGAKQLLASYGMGSLSPNTLVLGEMKRQETSQDYFGIIQAACAAKKNVIIVRDKHTIFESMHQIHVWWDDQSRSNSELMLLLSHMLISNKMYKGSSICLNSIASNEMGKEQRLSYFQDFFTKGRFSVTPSVYIQEEEQSPWEIMTRVSAPADMVLIGMNPPNQSENLEEFENHYYNLVQSTSEIPNAVFVICSEDMDISDIFN